MDVESSSRLSRELRTLQAMLRMYCRHHHGGRPLCESCLELARYADRRLACCPYGGEKPACSHCPIHCYRPDPRERVREVMRWSGPRMLWRHPVLAIRHLINERRRVPDRSQGGRTEPSG